MSIEDKLQELDLSLPDWLRQPARTSLENGRGI